MTHLNITQTIINGKETKTKQIHLTRSTPAPLTTTTTTITRKRKSLISASLLAASTCSSYAAAEEQLEKPTTFNASIKSLFNKTLTKALQSNFSDYTLHVTLPAALEQMNSITTNVSINTPAVHNMLGNSLLSTGRKALESSTEFPATTAQTLASIIAVGNKNRAATIIFYPTVSPESIVIPIVSCIFGFPILALLVICCLRRRAKLARERDRRRNYDNMQDHAVSLVRFSPIHRLSNRSTRAISLRPERSLSQGFTSLELDTVVEERCSDMDQTQTEMFNAESPLESVSYKMSFSS